jgi:hypothetical protein
VVLKPDLGAHFVPPGADVGLSGASYRLQVLGVGDLPDGAELVVDVKMQ